MFLACQMPFTDQDEISVCENESLILVIASLSVCLSVCLSVRIPLFLTLHLYVPMIDILGRYILYSYGVFDSYIPYILKHTTPGSSWPYNTPTTPHHHSLPPTYNITYINFSIHVLSNHTIMPYQHTCDITFRATPYTKPLRTAPPTIPNPHCTNTTRGAQPYED